jgi:hypothetical protein
LLPADHIFGTPYMFSTLDNAKYHVLYWAALSILQALISQVQSHVDQGAALDPLQDEEYLLSEFYADEICRALPYLLQDESKVWGAHVTLFAASQVAKVYMEFNKREKFNWTLHSFRVMGDFGSDFSHRLGEYLAYRWSLLDHDDLQPSESSSLDKHSGKLSSAEENFELAFVS